MNKSQNRELSKVRNFAIIAHIDHGKSTIADRLIEHCNGLDPREMKEQVLDSMDIERERGITIKSQTSHLLYENDLGESYILNLIDTPGHVDFSYEVSRALSACEGSLLIVDAAQGVEAQTLANVYQAIDNNHEIIPIINKVDLPAADPDAVIAQIEEVIGISADNAVLVSAKTGLGIRDTLDAIVKDLPAPTGDYDAPLQALLIDSWYDTYVGVVVLVRVVNGVVRPNDKIKMMSTDTIHNVDELGYFSPKRTPTKALYPGDIGYIIAGIKQVGDCKVGDTITLNHMPCTDILPGFKPNLPVVFCGLYPTDNSKYTYLKDSLAKLQLNDSGFEYTTETSGALGLGFRCGFLGLLHLEIVQERLSREFDLDLITTAPSVIYQIYMNDGEVLHVHNPADMPDITRIKEMKEPWIKANIMVPDQYLGAILDLCTQKRGTQQSLTYVGSRVMLIYKLPLNEIVFDFYDKLKSYSRGYASFDWVEDEYCISNLVKMNIMVNGEIVDALSLILHRDQAESRGRELCKKLKELIPRQMFQIAVQAAIGGKIIARETVSAMRKDVTAKCYGGDISRKRKLLDKQKEGKKKMRNIGKVSIPQSAFIAALKSSSDS